MEGFANKSANKSLRLFTVSLAMFAWQQLASPADLSLVQTTGNLFGSVINAEGIPQMGATIQLFDRVGRLRAQTASLANGRFAFAALPADSYSVRVTLAAYLPAISDRIAVRTGLDSMLQVHLATLLSSVELKYALPTGAMSNDWKWVLRSSPATRPVTRFQSESGERCGRVFSETHAALSVSGGDNSLLDTDALPGSGGTGFAVSTNIFGKNQLRLIGLLGQTAAMYPNALGFSAFYSRQDNGAMGSPSPEVTVTVTQLGLVNGMPGPAAAQFAVRTVSFNVYQALDLPADIHLEYGAAAEAVDLSDYSMRSSPFARITRSFGKAGDVVASFSDGSRPDALLAHQESGTGVADAASSSSLERMPELSYRNGQIEMQRTLSYELGFRKVSERRTVALSAFSERVSNGRLDVAGDRSALNPADLMSDGFSATSIYNIGNFRRSGIVLAADERLTSFMTGALSYARVSGFAGGSGTIAGDGTPAGLLSERMLDTVNVAVNAKVPKSGMRIVTSYGWVDSRAILPQHFLTTQSASIDPGMNLSFRQPLPTLFGMPGHLELRADLRNLLAQGYLPVDAGSGRTMLLVQAPRAVRGSVNFTF